MLDYYAFAGRYMEYMLKGGYSFDLYDVQAQYYEYCKDADNFSWLPKMPEHS